MRAGSILFTPKRIGPIVLKNRFMRSATWEARGNSDGTPSDDLKSMIIKLSEGDVGLIVPGCVCTARKGQSLINQSMMFSEAHAQGWKPVCDAAHANGSKVIFQIIHGGQQANPELNGGFAPLVPTATNANQKEMTDADIEEAIQDYCNSAALAIKAGADGIQLHGAHGYLLSTFLCPALNRRTDKWGGCDENRLRIVKEILHEVRAIAPSNFAITIKLNGDDRTNGGVTPPLAAGYVQSLLKDIDLFEISCGVGPSIHMISSNLDEKTLIRGVPKELRDKVVGGAHQMLEGVEFHEEYNLEAAKLIRKLVPTAPLALVGGNRQFAKMEKLVLDGTVDLISMSRPFIRDPLLLKKFLSGQEAYSTCTSCGSCFMGATSKVFCHLPQ